MRGNGDLFNSVVSIDLAKAVCGSLAGFINLPLQECSGGFSLGGMRVQPAEGMLGDQSGPVRVLRTPAGACSPEPRRDVHAPKPCPNEARHSTERPFLAPALDEPRPTSCPAAPYALIACFSSRKEVFSGFYLLNRRYTPAIWHPTTSNRQ